MLKYWSLIFYQSLRSSTTHMDIATIKTNKNQINRCHYNIFKDTISPMWCKLCIRNKQIQRAPCIKRASRMSFFILFSAIFFDLQYIATTLFGKKNEPICIAAKTPRWETKTRRFTKVSYWLVGLAFEFINLRIFWPKKKPSTIKVINWKFTVKKLA